jgi:hypothetical protein
MTHQTCDSVAAACFTSSFSNLILFSSLHARALGYDNSGQDRRRKLAYFRYEYLVWGGIAADDYRILGVFSGDGLNGRFYYALSPIPPISPTPSRPACLAISETMRLDETCRQRFLSRCTAVLGL